MKRMKRWAALLFAAVFLLSGCDKGDTASETTSSAPTGPTGRYVEAEITPPDAVKAQSVRSAALRVRPDGTLDYLVSQEDASGDSGIRHYHSPDGGNNWESMETDWLGDVLTQCGFPERDQGAFFPAMEIDEEGNIYCASWDTDYNPRFFKKSPGSAVTEYPIDLGQEKIFRVDRLRVTEGGHLGLILWGEKDRAVLLDGKQTLQSTEIPLMCEAAFSEDEIVIADMELTFYSKDGKKTMRLPHADMDMALECAGGTVFAASRDGVDCLEQGSALFETFLHGSQYTFSDPNNTIALLRCNPADRTFYMAVDTGGTERLFRYAFDPNMPIKPDQQLDVFSMEDSPSIRGAIVRFQREHPMAAVNYQVGADSPMEPCEVETALRQALDAGEGPDVLLLDGLDLGTYAKWLGPLETEIPGSFRNITSAFQSVGALPARFQLWLDVESEGIIPYRQRITGVEGLDYTLSGFQEEQGAVDLAALHGYFLPSAVLGISGASGQRELAEAFVMEMLSDSVQAEDYGEGFPVIEAQFRSWITEDYRERFKGLEDGLVSLCERLEQIEQ